MTGLDLTQFKYDIVLPTLQKMAMALPPVFSPWAINQVTGTALVESGLCYLEQLGGGPALGICQMEPATHYDCWVNFINYNPQLKIIMLEIAGASSMPDALLLVENLAYSVAMARIKYWRSHLAPPAANDAVGCANYHKDIYNSALGAASVAVNTPLFAQAIAA